MPVRLHVEDKTIICGNHPQKSNLLHLIQESGIDIEAACGGHGTCGACEVILLSGEFFVEGKSVKPSPATPLRCKSCLTTLLSHDADISIPTVSILNLENALILDETSLPQHNLNPAIHQFELSIPAAALKNPQSNRSRLMDALKAAGGPADIYIPSTLLAPLSGIPGDSASTVYTTVAMTSRGCRLIDIARAEQKKTLFGLAVDIGTTTVATTLVRLEDGHLTSRASSFNQQIKHGDDVASRISYCRTREHVEQLQKLLIQNTINPLIKKSCAALDISPDQIVHAVFSGNTVMIHLALGISPDSIGRIPFHPVIHRPDTESAKHIGLDINPRGIVDFIPCASGYIGGDIVADLYVSQSMIKSTPVLLIDIGTNGEMALCSENKIKACATAAGPAFEGRGIRDGCRAVSGAIAHIRISNTHEFELDIIGHSKPIGLCGTAVIDFIAVGQRAGFINRIGRFDIEKLKQMGRYAAVKDGTRTLHSCTIVEAEESDTGQALLITEFDISQIINAKAAIQAGIQTLLLESNVRLDEISNILLAGGFARYLDVHNAIAIGLLPDVSPDQFTCIGNGALAGACIRLLDRDSIQPLERLSRAPEIIELNQTASFTDHFHDALGIPSFGE